MSIDNLLVLKQCLGFTPTLYRLFFFVVYCPQIGRTSDLVGFRSWREQMGAAGGEFELKCLGCGSSLPSPELGGFTATANGGVNFSQTGSIHPPGSWLGLDVN